ncbi:MAG: efflux RND transporter periplasmic adaptor subunit [Acetobacteraceae bacterium]|nr:efflux RND transporter periplasmic adaptor subunit [Acetobacteraceae bacterium]
MLLAAVVAAVLGLGGATLLSIRGPAVFGRAPPPPPPAAEPPPALTVSIAAAAERPMPRVVVGDGSVVAWQELVIGAEAGGLRVVEVAVEEGDRVRRGQLLARLEDSVLKAQRDAAEASVQEAEAALRVARQDLVRSEELSRGQIAARQTLEQREAAARQAEARLGAARARRDEAAARLAQTRVLAPTDGTVSRRTALLGAVVPAGQEMVRLVRDDRLELDARVPELDLAAVAPGQRVRVAHGERAVEARVRAVAPTVAAETRLGVVHVALPPDSGLRPGMFARAEVQIEAATALTVPQEAVVFREGRPAVFVLAGDDRVALRPVAAGRRREGAVEVLEGLAAGERVVVAGAGFLSDGDRVRSAGAAPGVAAVR